MAELSGAEVPKVSREELLRTAARLFTGVAFQSHTVIVTPDIIVDRVLPEVEQAVQVEYDRARDEELQKQEQEKAAWRRRSIGTVIGDILRRRNYCGFGGAYELKPNISYMTISERSISGSLPLGEDWPRLPVYISQEYFKGSLAVARQEFTLDPEAYLLRVGLCYPVSDSVRTDLGVAHTLYPYGNKIKTETRVIFGGYWSGIPHQPFSDKPADPSVYMNRAMEMLIEGQGTTYTYR
ncbi:MAG TPA: hypothetical protein VLE73_06420 [Candidatus Saccharimonadales bacterium]|nr:hypothetical protein [Candidatus Saccharimonadales bacterium]